MATVYNMRGTSFPSFTIGKRGVTLFQGTDTPENDLGVDGDIYLQRGADTSQFMWQKVAGSWVTLQFTNERLQELSAMAAEAGMHLGMDVDGLVLRTSAEVKTLLGLGSAASKNTGTAVGDVVAVGSDGRIDGSLIPDIALTSVNVVEDDAARDALVVQEGDVAIISSTGMTYLYDGTAWRLMGAAGSVQAIKTTTGSKSGVVSLDSADILSGIFEVSRGGTGFNSFAKGDFLVGTAGGTLAKLPVGTNNQVLGVANGDLVWQDFRASNVSFYQNDARFVTASNVKDALDEIANERVYVNTADYDPTPDDHTGYRAGDLWINTLSNHVFVANHVEDGVTASWQKLGTNAKQAGVYVVSKSGDDTNGDGGFDRPFASVGKALSKVHNNDSVLVLAGEYIENINVATNGIALIGHNAVITGKTIVSASGFTASGVVFNNIAVHALELNGCSGAVFRNSRIQAANPDVVAVKLTGVMGTNNVFKNCDILGKVQGAAIGVEEVTFDGATGFGLLMDSGAVRITNAATIRAVTHTAGVVRINNVGRIIADGNGDSIVSTASSASGSRLLLNNVNLLQEDGSFGKINRTGDCSFMLNAVVRDNAQHFTDDGRIYGFLAEDILADVAPTNYTAGLKNLRSHLQGIDTRLGSIGGAVVTKFKDLSDVATYTVGDADRTLVVNSTGTGVTYGPILGTASTKNTEDFATAAQGAKANSAVQPSELSAIALAGQGNFLKLTDSPDTYENQGRKIVRVNADASGLEFAGPLGSAAYSNSYLDLQDRPSLGTAASKDVGTNEGNVPVLMANGKLDTSILPSLAITDIYVVSDLTERDALDVQGGDVAKVTGTGQTFIYDGNTWMELTSANGVMSVNGKSGTVILSAADITTGNTPVNYTVAQDNIKTHIQSIDIALGTKITKTAFTNAGDILVGSGSGTYAALPKGTSGQVLTTDAMGQVVWAAPTGGSGGTATGDKIETGTTSVKTAEVANTITVNANGKRVANFSSGANAAVGERLDVTTDNQKVILAATNAAGTGKVDLEFKSQGAGAVSFNLAGTASMRSGAGEALTIQPGDSTGAGVALTLMGGNAGGTNNAGGDIILQPGNFTGTGAAGQVKLPTGYVPSSADSVVNRSFVTGRRLDELNAPTANVSMNNQNLTNVKDPVNATDAVNRQYVERATANYAVSVVSTSDNYQVSTNDKVVITKRNTSAATTITLPLSTTISLGKVLTIKDGKGDANVNHVTIIPNPGDTASVVIDGAMSQVIANPYESITVIWNGTDWSII